MIQRIHNSALSYLHSRHSTRRPTTIGHSSIYWLSFWIILNVFLNGQCSHPAPVLITEWCLSHGRRPPLMMIPLIGMDSYSKWVSVPQKEFPLDKNSSQGVSPWECFFWSYCSMILRKKGIIWRAYTQQLHITTRLEQHCMDAEMSVQQPSLWQQLSGFFSPPETVDRPLPIHNVKKPRSDKKSLVLVACGSFNPPTVAHLRMFDLAIDELNKVSLFMLSLICLSLWMMLKHPHSYLHSEL